MRSGATTNWSVTSSTPSRRTASRARPRSHSSAAGGKVQLGPIAIQATEREVAITFSQEKRTFETTGPRGRMMFTLIHDLKNRLSTQVEIQDAMAERGWRHPNNVCAPELAKMKANGDLISEGERPMKYRVPGKLIVYIDGKKV
jgi:hypothetical protein